ncbi:MAG: signal recognition particle-docking protein FtsY [Candidatus Babeliales bacterium]
MFNFIKNSFSSIYATFTNKIGSLFTQKNIDNQTLKELEKILIEADTGVKTTKRILDALQEQFQKGLLKQGSDLKEALAQELLASIKPTEKPEAEVYLLVGINGSGKTTFCAKLAHSLLKANKKVLLAAGDTFRAAATEQLVQWGTKLNIPVITGSQAKDPGAVVFEACSQYKQKAYDTLIIDTAGRLQTKVNLMQELAKLKRIIQKQLPEAKICTLLTVDAMLGQNSFEQARLFHEATELDGIVLTKMDGTGKGGIVFAISQELGLPVYFMSFGEKEDQLKHFNAQEYIDNLLAE